MLRSEMVVTPKKSERLPGKTCKHFLCNMDKNSQNLCFKCRSHQIGYNADLRCEHCKNWSVEFCNKA